MEPTQIEEIKQAIASLTMLVKESMDSKMQILMFGEIKQALESLATMVTSAVEAGQIEIERDEKRRNGGLDWDRSKSMLDRARERVRRIISDSTYTHPLCLRCGGKEHLAKQCCGLIMCFACEKTGHRSRDCTEIIHQLKPQHNASFDNHKILSFSMNFHIDRDIEYERQNSQWIWKPKEVQEKKKGVNQEEALKVGEKSERDDSKISKISDAMVEMPVSKDMVEIPVLKAMEDTEKRESSAKTKALVQMPVKDKETKVIDHSEAKKVTFSGAKEEEQKEMQHGFLQVQKEIKV